MSSDSLSQLNFLNVKAFDEKDCMLNVNYIRYIIRDNLCYRICSRMNGCNKDNNNMLTVCKNDETGSWEKVNKLFN